MTHTDLYTLSYDSLLDLCSEDGINASARTEAYGCIFGRDSAITILKTLRSYHKKPDPALLAVCKRTLLTLVSLQGKTFNLESGEEPGKCIHEFRKDNYERLIKRPKPWYVYPDEMLRNYDSVDATPLFLIALHRYWQVSGDTEFLLHILPAVEEGLKWIMVYGDKDHDHLIEYELPINRSHGGLVVQSWTDSHDCLADKTGLFPYYPIAAVEVQAYCWLALKVWSDFFQTQKPALSVQLQAFTRRMKEKFNQVFLTQSAGHLFLAQALDGLKRQIPTVTGNPLLVLWATYQRGEYQESILDNKYIKEVVTRGFMPDMFEADAGIRTMSTLSDTFNPHVTSYHNGSFWPMLNGMIHEGLENWGFADEAERLAQATLNPIRYFTTPIELYIKDENGSLLEYTSPRGKKGCRYQAWTAASILDLVS